MALRDTMYNHLSVSDRHNMISLSTGLKSWNCDLCSAFPCWYSRIRAVLAYHGRTGNKHAKPVHEVMMII